MHRKQAGGRRGSADGGGGGGGGTPIGCRLHDRSSIHLQASQFYPLQALTRVQAAQAAAAAPPQATGFLSSLSILLSRLVI